MKATISNVADFFMLGLSKVTEILRVDRFIKISHITYLKLLHMSDDIVIF
ncbi:hypothetical protein [Thorsellia kenyensis]|uniref:Uncharacterized protein n=1 Tax=Thorsellia kenyensis TaxID=1549888 RepID=A0ABV6CBN3_9GAMM